ncbi:MAG: SUKH-3 domain-containing protein [Saprospiraceae bacterium]|nr:SUKH-3 domain-containing protein [Saprospiraceae bacterium]
MSKVNYSKLFNKLKAAGWFEGRYIHSEKESTSLKEYFPTKILDFFREFGDLALKSDLSYISHGTECFYMDMNIYGISMLNSINDNSINEEDDRFNINDPINFGEDAQYYYYSSLIGTNLFAVAGTKNSLGIYMDEFGNFYEITDITQLIWIANNPIDALEQLLYGTSDALELNEERLEWMGRINEPLKYNPPINKNLTENPWR